MNWDYVAGLFDGDGFVRVYFTKSTHSKVYNPTLSVSIDVSGDVIMPLKRFLVEQGCLPERGREEGSYTYNYEGAIGEILYIRFHSWGGVEKFVINTLPKAYIKKEQLSLTLDAINLRKKILKNGERICDNLVYFDEIRKELHKLARKGPKTLREYDWRNEG